MISITNIILQSLPTGFKALHSSVHSHKFSNIHKQNGCPKFICLLSPASRSEEGGLLNSPPSVRPSVRPSNSLYHSPGVAATLLKNFFFAPRPPPQMINGRPLRMGETYFLRRGQVFSACDFLICTAPSLP